MPRSLKHPEVDILPSGAKTVKQYCIDNNISTTLFYHWIKRGKSTYSIVIFQGINFVLPL